MLSCNSKVCVDVAIAPEINQVTRRRYAKPEWHKSQAKFIINLCIEKQRRQQQQQATSSKGNNIVIFDEEGGFESRFGSRNATSSPDSYVWRQRFLRSYTFTRKEDSRKTKRKMVVGLLPNVLKRMWIKKVNVVNGIHKEGKKICGCCVHGCLRFLLCFFGQKFDVLD
ncbi:hypothetical protein LINPERHAP1_LOCUS27244 [Linum perenne]